MVLLKKAAPSKMNMNMQVERAGPIKPALKFAQVRLRLHAAKANAPTTP